nr:GIY-YIG nuclease family protein [Candidatus Sigynarchaeota archaeon]
MYYVYILECRGSGSKMSLYTGYTNSVARRFAEHSTGRGARYTKGKALKIVFIQSFLTQIDAMRRERDIKRLPRRKKIALISNGFVNEQKIG